MEEQELCITIRFYLCNLLHLFSFFFLSLSTFLGKKASQAQLQLAIASL